MHYTIIPSTISCDSVHKSVLCAYHEPVTVLRPGCVMILKNKTEEKPAVGPDLTELTVW